MFATLGDDPEKPLRNRRVETLVRIVIPIDRGDFFDGLNDARTNQPVLAFGLIHKEACCLVIVVVIEENLIPSTLREALQENELRHRIIAHGTIDILPRIVGPDTSSSPHVITHGITEKQ